MRYRLYKVYKFESDHYVNWKKVRLPDFIIESFKGIEDYRKN